MTEPRNYTQWTFEDHLTKAVTLAAKADDLADGEGANSQAALRREHIRQTTARGLLHAQIADLKKTDATVTGAPAGTESSPAVKLAGKPATAAKVRAQQAGDGNE